MPHHRLPDGSGTTFSARFLAAVLLIVVVEADVFYAFSEQVTIARVDPGLINDTGRQQLLAAQIDALAHHFRYASADSIRGSVQRELAETVAQMNVITERLVRTAYSSEVKDFLESPPAGLAPRMRDYATTAATVAAGPGEAELSRLLSELHTSHETLNEDIEVLTHLLEEEYRNTLRMGQSLRLAGGGVVILTLMLLGLFVFRPMEMRLRGAFEQVKEDERRFRLLVENAYDLISILNPDGTYQYTSPSLYRLTGYSPAEIAGRSGLDLVHPEDRARIGDKLERLARSPHGSVNDVEIRILTKEGDVRYLEAIATNLFDDPNVGGIVVNSRDVTDRKRAEQELRRHQAQLEVQVERRTSELQEANDALKEQVVRRWEAESELIERERHFRKIIMGASDPILIQELGEEGVQSPFTEVNEAACRFLGYSREELLKLSPADVVEGFVALGPDALERMRNDRTLVQEMNVITKDGRRLPFECRIDLHEIGDTKILTSVARDISSRQAAEQAIRREKQHLEKRVTERTALLEEQRRELEAANDELEAFAYTVSHDLRSPIRSLTGFSKMAIDRLNGSADESLHHFLARIHANAEKMEALLEDLLEYSKIGRATARRTTVEPRPLVEELLRDLLSADEQRAVAIELEDLPPAEADRVLLRQVYQNLLSNAIKFTRGVAAPRVVIGAAERDGETVYYVKDNGVGFDPQYADKLFGVFRRLHSAKEYEGTGAGLAIVERIIRKHGGRIWAESRVDEGAKFYFTLCSGTAHETTVQAA